MIVAAIIALTLGVVRLLLPSIVRDRVNKKLESQSDYRGHVSEIGISLWRGAYQIRRLKIEKLGGEVPVPFFSCRLIDLSVEWKALLHGRIVGKVLVDRPILNFVKGPTEAKSQTKINKSWAQLAQDAMPLTVNRFVIDDGEIHYRDFDSQPKVDIVLSSISAVATNLSTIERKDEALPANVQVRATCFETGALDLRVALDPLKEAPTFELKETLRGVQLVKLNDVFEAYAKIKVKKGEFGLYTEIAGKDGSFVGYTKPIIHNLEVDKGSKANPTLLKKLWAEIGAAVGWLLKNPQKDQVATTIPIKGTFDKAEVGVWIAVGGLLKNAFIQALLPALDNTISIADVKPSASVKAALQEKIK